MANKGYLIDFIKDASNKNISKDWDLGKNFIEYLRNCTDEKALSEWFYNNDYSVSWDDCIKLINNKEGIISIKDVANQKAY
jgi:hypothetical protein